MAEINLDDPDIMSAEEAEKIWKKDKFYVQNSIKHSPNQWPKGSYRLIGSALIVTTDGMESATGEKDPRKK